MSKETKATTKKTAAKKPATKKPSAKKPVAKKVAVSKTAAAKKPAAKKAAVSKTAAAKKSPAKKPAAKKPVGIEAETIVNKTTHKTANTASGSSSDSKPENVFPGLAKDRDWQNFALRVAYIITFGVLGWIAFGAAITMTIIQVIITVLLGAPNETLQNWVSAIGKYLAEVFEYISWNTDEKPFPLGRPVPLDK